MIADLISQYGPVVIGAVFTALAGFVARHFLATVWLRDMLGRLVTEAKAAVLEVEQTYVDELAKAKEDGTLTAEEGRIARNMAIATLKSNLGTKGLRRLGRILGLTDDELDRLLGSHVEAAVKQLTLAQMAPSKVITMSTPPLSSSR